MMPSSLPLLLLALSSVLSAPAALNDADGYTQVVVSQKRAALVLDRLLIALQKALQEGDKGPSALRVSDEGPRAAPVRLGRYDDADRQIIDHKMGSSGEAAPLLLLREVAEPRTAPLRTALVDDDTSALQRRGQGGVRRATVLRCYFNAITCF